MNKEKYHNWIKEFMDSWKELDYKRVLETLDEKVEYYENPIDDACNSFDEVISL